MVSRQFAAGFAAALAVSEVAIGNGILASTIPKMMEWGAALSVILFENNFRALVAVCGACFALVFAGLPSIETHTTKDDAKEKKVRSSVPAPRWDWFQLCNYLAVFVFILSSCAILNQRNHHLRRNEHGSNLAGRSIMIFAATAGFLSLGYMLAFFGVSFVSLDVESDTDDLQNNLQQALSPQRKIQLGTKGTHRASPKCSAGSYEPPTSVDNVTCKNVHAKSAGIYENPPAGGENAVESCNKDAEDGCIEDGKGECNIALFTGCLSRTWKGPPKGKKWRALKKLKKRLKPKRKPAREQEPQEVHTATTNSPRRRSRSRSFSGSNTSRSRNSTISSCGPSSLHGIAKTIQDNVFPLTLSLAGICGEVPGGEDSAWDLKLDNKRKGVKVSNRMLKGSTWAALKAEIVIPHDPEVVKQVVTDITMAPLLDDMMDHLLPLNAGRIDAGSNGTVVAGTAMRWSKAKGVWPTSPRDFVVLSGIVSFAEARRRGWLQGPVAGDEEGSYIVASRSADELLPLLDRASATAAESQALQKLAKSDASASCVRGMLNVSGFILRKVGATTELTMIAHAELNGSLPSALINKFAISTPAKMVQAIQKKSGECAKIGIDAVLGR